MFAHLITLLLIILTLNANSDVLKLKEPNCINKVVSPPTTVKSYASDRNRVDISRAIVMGENPPEVPENTVTLNEQEVDRLIRETPPEYLEAVQFLIQQIRRSHINFSKFLSSLLDSTQKFVDENKELVTHRQFVSYSYFTFDGHWEDKKSNLWTLELINEYSRDLGFLSQVDNFAKVRLLVQRMKELGVKDVLITDDASYSGRQLGAILTILSRALDKGTTVHLVIPFMTKKAREIAESFSSKINVKIYSVAVIDSFETVVETSVKKGELSEEGVFRLKELVYLEPGKSLVYFDHKIPDVFSSPNSHISKIGLPISQNLVIPTKNGLRSFKLIDELSNKPY